MSDELFRGKLNRVIIASCTSTSGNYKLFLAEHIVAGKFCYDVGAFHVYSGRIICRHYNLDPNDSTNKAEALRIYDEFREKLQAPAKPQETDEQERMIFINPTKSYEVE